MQTLTNSFFWVISEQIMCMRVNVQNVAVSNLNWSLLLPLDLFFTAANEVLGILIM